MTTYEMRISVWSADVCSSELGIVLAVGLMLLVVITLIGLAAVRTTTMQQRMTANFYDREIASQSAEAALQGGAQTLTNGTAVIARLCGQVGRASGRERVGRDV